MGNIRVWFGFELQNDVGVPGEWSSQLWVPCTHYKYQFHQLVQGYNRYPQQPQNRRLLAYNMHIMHTSSPYSVSFLYEVVVRSSNL